MRGLVGGPAQRGFCVPAGLWKAAGGDGSLLGRTHTEKATVLSPPPSAGVLSSP